MTKDNTRVSEYQNGQQRFHFFNDLLPATILSPEEFRLELQKAIQDKETYIFSIEDYIFNITRIEMDIRKQKRYKEILEAGLKSVSLSDKKKTILESKLERAEARILKYEQELMKIKESIKDWKKVLLTEQAVLHQLQLKLAKTLAFPVKGEMDRHVSHMAPSWGP